MTRSLDTLFAEVLARYPSVRRDEKFGRDSSFWPLIGEIKSALEVVPVLAASKRVKLKVSFGQGGWAEVPNIAIMDAKETERPSAGLYMVYLFRADLSGVVLSLNQGSADLIFEMKNRAFPVLQARAEKLRAAIQPAVLAGAGFTSAPLDLASTAQYPRAYAAGNVVSKTYLGDALPDEATMLGDLAVLHGVYQSLIPSSRLRPGAVAPRF